MAQELVSDEWWGLIEPLLPPPRPQPKGGRRPVPHRAALSGIILVLKSGIPWERLLQEMGGGADALVAESVSPPEDSLRTQR